MIELLTSRSRVLDTMRCNRSRWELHERNGTGLEPVKRAIPLVTGAGLHLGAAALLRTRIGSGPVAPFSEMELDLASSLAVAQYEQACKGRGLEIDQLEDQSYVFNEQRALVEALVRLAGLRVIPALLSQYEVLEVEQLDKSTLWEERDPNPVCHCGIDLKHHSVYENHTFTEMESPEDFRITWRSISDALLRNRTDGQLYLLSWKTCSQFPQDSEARVDMQGVSEAWALQGRLDQDWTEFHAQREYFNRQGGPLIIDSWRTWMESLPEPPKIRGVQMVYLLKGPRRIMSKEHMTARGLTQEQLDAGGRMYKQASPLIYGYSDQNEFQPKFAFDLAYSCTDPHPFRYAKGGTCPGGKNHKLGDSWTSFPVWDTVGVKQWMALLDSQKVLPSNRNALDEQWTLPVPNYRTQEQMGDWLAQTQASERRVAQALLQLRQDEQSLDADGLRLRLNWSVMGPQATEHCDHWFGRKCPAWELCHGSAHVQDDPVGSGLYMPKTALDESADRTGEEQ